MRGHPYLEKWEVEERIMDAAAERLQARTGEGGRLGEVEELVRIELAGKRPEFPAVWIEEGECKAVGGTLAATEYEKEVAFISQVKAGEDAMRGRREARRLSAMTAREMRLDDAGGQDPQLGGLPGVLGVEEGASRKVPATGSGLFAHLETVKVRFLARR